jgi:hypothetical protein
MPDRQNVNSNLTDEELAEFLDALDNNKTKYVKGTMRAFAWLRNWEEEYKGERYLIEENIERLVSVNKL